MHETAGTLESVLVLLAASVFAVAVSRWLRLPPVVGYLVTGIALGPRVLGVAPDAATTQGLAEFGVVFLMFTIGLEFSLPKLVAMRRIVFGLGLAQVTATMALAVAAALAMGTGWAPGLVIGAILAMSSTAIVSKLLSDRVELDSEHGRTAIGVLLLQDLAVVPLVILVPALGEAAAGLGTVLALALAKAAVLLLLVTVAGPRVMRTWLGVVARRRSNELFVLNVLLIVVALAWLTSVAGLSLALGAFVAGMLISETEYRFQVEQDIRPFRDVLLGLFFVSVGMLLDPAAIARSWELVVVFFVVLVAGKALLVALLARVFGHGTGTAIRTGLVLAQGSEFGFVLVTLAGSTALVGEATLQSLLAALILSMIAAPLIIASSGRIAMRFSSAEWMTRSLDLTRIATETLEADRHVVILGYGRNGQHLARLLEEENVSYVALDLDPEHVREGTLAGDRVVFADCSRREALVAAGVARASAVVITFADVAAATRALANVHELAPSVPVIARAHAEADIARLEAAGATEIVPEAFESGLMLAVHTLVLTGVPFARAIRRMRQVRDERYRLLQGFFHGASDAAEGEVHEPRLHAVTLVADAWAIGREAGELGVAEFGVEVRAVRRPGTRQRLEAGAAGVLLQGDVVVMLGTPTALANAEARLLNG